MGGRRNGKRADSRRGKEQRTCDFAKISRQGQIAGLLEKRGVSSFQTGAQKSIKYQKKKKGVLGQKRHEFFETQIKKDLQILYGKGHPSSGGLWGCFKDHQISKERMSDNNSTLKNCTPDKPRLRGRNRPKENTKGSTLGGEGGAM